LSPDELWALADDIKKRGQKLPIKHLADGRILDGRNRELACRIAGVEPWYEMTRPTEFEIPALIASLNLHRRHLTREEKRRLVEAILRAEPNRSNRSIAGTTGVSHHTVGAIRTELETTGTIAQLTNCVGQDGRTRRVPSSVPKCGGSGVNGQEGDRRGPQGGNRSASPAVEHYTPGEIQELLRSVTRLASLIGRIAGEDTPIGRTLIAELRQRDISLQVDAPITNIETGRVTLGQYVRGIPVLERIREAVEATGERIRTRTEVQK
jgi:hypothetical protein